MREIKLTQGKIALVSDEDFDHLNQFKWFAMEDGGTYYAGRVTSRKLGKQRIIKMHREILELNDPKIICDHRDHDGLNNQRNNLRIASFSQNATNKRSCKNKTSNFLGVCLRKDRGTWLASIQINKKTRAIGCFKKETDAALAYNKAAVKIHGEFANLNIV